jgi:hypothetical protein
MLFDDFIQIPACPPECRPVATRKPPESHANRIREVFARIRGGIGGVSKANLKSEPQLAREIAEYTSGTFFDPYGWFQAQFLSLIPVLLPV